MLLGRSRLQLDVQRGKSDSFLLSGEQQARSIVDSLISPANGEKRSDRSELTLQTGGHAGLQVPARQLTVVVVDASSLLYHAQHPLLQRWMGVYQAGNGFRA